MALELEDLTGAVIGAAIEVHRTLGPGFLESVYEEALVIELVARKVSFARQYSVTVRYRGVDVGLHRLDLFVADQLVVELKATKDLTPEHYAVVRSYLRATDREHGLLLNFSKPKLEIKRVIARALND